MNRKNDDFSCLIDALNKRKEILKKGQSVKKYNRYFEVIRRCVRGLIDENRQEEMLPYLDDPSISVRYDVAQFLYNSYPQKCRAVLQEISEMSSRTGLPEYLGNVRLSAIMTLEYGVPEDFP